MKTKVTLLALLAGVLVPVNSYALPRPVEYLKQKLYRNDVKTNTEIRSQTVWQHVAHAFKSLRKKPTEIYTKKANFFGHLHNAIKKMKLNWADYQLQKAAKNSDSAAMKEAIANGADVDQAMRNAIDNKNDKAVTFLINDKNKNMALKHAITTDNTDMLKKITTLKPSLHTTAWKYALDSNNESLQNFFFENNIEPDQTTLLETQKNKYQKFLQRKMTEAIDQHNSTKFEKAMQAGADINQLDIIKLLTLLLEFTNNNIFSDKQQEQSAKMLFAILNNPQLNKEKTLEDTIKNYNSNQSVAFLERLARIQEILIKYGIRLSPEVLHGMSNEQQKQYQDLLQEQLNEAIRGGNVTEINNALTTGAKINQPDAYGTIPLHTAMQTDAAHPERTIKTTPLIINHPNFNKNAAMKYAITKGFGDMQNLLLQNGAATIPQEALKLYLLSALEGNQPETDTLREIERASENGFDFTTPIKDHQTVLDVAIEKAELPGIAANLGNLLATTFIGSGTHAFTTTQAKAVTIITALKDAITNQIAVESDRLANLRTQQIAKYQQAETLSNVTLPAEATAEQTTEHAQNIANAIDQAETIEREKITPLEAKLTSLLSQQEQAAQALATLQEMRDTQIARTTANATAIIAAAQAKAQTSIERAAEAQAQAAAQAQARKQAAQAQLEQVKARLQAKMKG